MRAVLTLVVAVVYAVTSTSAQNVPVCAVTCVASANTGSCNVGDFTCLCANQAFLSSVAGCLKSTCSSADQKAAAAAASTYCAQASLTIPTPSSSSLVSETTTVPITSTFPSASSSLSTTDSLSTASVPVVGPPSKFSRPPLSTIPTTSAPGLSTSLISVATSAPIGSGGTTALGPSVISSLTASSTVTMPTSQTSSTASSATTSSSKSGAALTLAAPNAVGGAFLAIGLLASWCF